MSPKVMKSKLVCMCENKRAEWMRWRGKKEWVGGKGKEGKWRKSVLETVRKRKHISVKAVICRKEAQGQHACPLCLAFCLCVVCLISYGSVQRHLKSHSQQMLQAWILNDVPFMPRTSVPVTFPLCALRAEHLVFIPCILTSYHLGCSLNWLPLWRSLLLN